MSPRIILVGPPGSGKTTAGKLLAQQLGVGFRDTDVDVASVAGKSIPDIFVDHGEEYFRQLEHEAVALALREHNGVLALGGGAVLSAETRKLLTHEQVVFLSVGLSAAVKRIGLGVGRPLLTINPRATLKALLEERRGLYTEICDITIDTDERSTAQVVSQLTDWLDVPSVVPVGANDDYNVIIGADATIALPDVLGDASRAAIIYAEPLRDHVARVAQFISDVVDVELIEVPDAESAKTVDVAAQCWDLLATANFTRDDLIIGVGGGAVTDLAGFVAACWLRGISVVQLPTSLLGMVDAAVGGKTGVNTSFGKNMVGAFHPPKAVICDLTVLDTLPHHDRIAGMAEIVKCGFIADASILSLIDADPALATSAAGRSLAPLVQRAVEVKAGVVSQDLKETGRRAILNYGHTFGHAIEKVENYQWRHGDAVAVGMMFAAVLGASTGHADVVAQTREVLTQVGLPVSYPSGRFSRLYDAMRRDKKATADTMRFVLLDDIAKPVVVSGVTAAQLEQAYEEIAE